MPSVETGNVPVNWARFFVVIGIVKAAIGGAGAALAILGAYNVAAAVSASDWLHAVQHSYALDTFAAAGGLTGAVLKIIFK